MQSHVLLPTKTAIAVVVVLIFSLFAHISVILTHVRALSIFHAHDEPTIPIDVRAAALTFVKTQRFGLYANDSDWDSAIPQGDGFIYLPSHDEHYLVAHYHQMHCLRALRNYFLDPSTMDKMDFGHVNHCLFYLREMALCNFDTTLEPANHKQRALSGHISLAVTGMGVTHRCRDWSQVWDYMNFNYREYKESYGRKTAEFVQSLKDEGLEK